MRLVDGGVTLSDRLERVQVSRRLVELQGGARLLILVHTTAHLVRKLVFSGCVQNLTVVVFFSAGILC